MRKNHLPSSLRLNHSRARRGAFLLLTATAFFIAPALRAEVLITEFMASNNETLQDEDGDASDWIELLNTGPAAVDLAGWSLTDKASNLRLWIFPQVTLAPRARLIVFASEKNRRNPGAPLHTNFKLSADGEYLALARLDGTAAHTFAPRYPAQITDVSYGLPVTTSTVTVSSASATARFRVPQDGTLGLTWTAPDFDATAWTAAAQGLGFETTPGLFAPYISAAGNLQAAMHGSRTSVFVRIPFTVPANVAALRLRLRYDDGSVAWLNGVQVADFLAPDIEPIPWDAAATDERLNEESIAWEEHVIPSSEITLRSGTNFLAVQLLNRATSNPDLLLQTEIVADLESYDPASHAYFSQSTPGELNGAGTLNPGPIIREATSAVPRPAPGVPMAPPIIATVAPSFHPIASVTLKARTMYGAESSVVMRDDGAGGDAVAGDGTFTAALTSTLTAGQMLRWRIVATDTQGGTATAPPFPDPVDSPQYFGTVATDPALGESQLPVFHWFLPPGADPDSVTGARISVFYLDEFYDNIEARRRGRSTASFAKKGHNLDFNDGARFRWREGERRVKDIDLITNWADKSHVRLSLAYEICRLAGIPTHFAFPVRVQRNAAFHGIFDMIEDGDDRFLARAGLDPVGALYKFKEYNHLRAPVAGYVKKTREDEADTDLENLVAAIAEPRPLADRRRYAYDELDLPSIVNYHALCALLAHRDQGGKNFYVYRDTNGSQQWQFLPWDLDLTLGHTFTYAGTTSWGASYTAQGYFDDDIDSQQILRVGWDNPIKQLLWNVPELNEMFVRRVKTLADQFIGSSAAPSNYFPQRVAEILDRLDPPGTTGLTDAELDFRKWGFWVDGSGTVLPWTNAAAALHRIRPQAARILSANPHPDYPGVAEYARFFPVNGVPLPVRNLNSLPPWLPGRRDFFYTPGLAVSGNLGLPASPAAPVDTFQIEAVDVNPAAGQDAEYLAIRNTGAASVDLSGWKLTGAIDYTFPGGCVLPVAGTAPVGTLYVAKKIAAFRQRATGPRGGEFRLVVGGYSGQLSARGEIIELRRPDGSLALSHTTPAQPTLLQQSLRVSALLYAPTPPTAAETAAAPGAVAEDFEWIELLNTGAPTLDLSGARFIEGIDLVFPATTSLAPGQRILVVGQIAAFRARYGSGPAVAGTFAGNLDNSGEQLHLVDATGESVLEFRYEGEWSPAADGLGHALIVKAPAATPFSAWDAASTWAPSATAAGTPGQPATAALSFREWQAAHFTAAELANIAISSATADPDGDGIANLLEYTSNRPPRQSSPALTSVLTLNGDTLQLDIPRDPLAVDSVLTFEQTASLAPPSWQPITPATTQTLPGGALRVTFPATGAQFYLRAKAQLP